MYLSSLRTFFCVREREREREREKERERGGERQSRERWTNNRRGGGEDEPGQVSADEVHNIPTGPARPAAETLSKAFLSTSSAEDTHSFIWPTRLLEREAVRAGACVCVCVCVCVHCLGL